MNLSLQDREERFPGFSFKYLVLEVQWIYNENWNAREGLIESDNVFISYDEAREFCDIQNFQFLVEHLHELNCDIIWQPSIIARLKQDFPAIIDSEDRLQMPESMKDWQYFTRTMTDWGFCKYEILQIRTQK